MENSTNFEAQLVGLVDELRRAALEFYGQKEWDAVDIAFADYMRGGSNWGEFWDFAEALDQMEQDMPLVAELGLFGELYCAAEAFTGSRFDGWGNPKEVI